jgi:hypothetical protein
MWHDDPVIQFALLFYLGLLLLALLPAGGSRAGRPAHAWAIWTLKASGVMVSDWPARLGELEACWARQGAAWIAAAVARLRRD